MTRTEYVRDSVVRGTISAVRASDPRAERTRQAIFASVRTLMTQRVASVSVSDIVRTASISRSSFYAHFSSLDDLATGFLREQFAEIGVSGFDLLSDDLTGAQAARVGYQRLISHIVEHYPLYSSVLDLPITRTAYDDEIEAYSRRLVESLVVLSGTPRVVHPESFATYVAGGALTLISAWMRGQLDVTDDEIVDQLVEFLPEWLVDAA
ncbi:MULTISPECIES: TetR/AcrR family transcriptional regulator [unclassified Cryobacterium]|uniref:TetR/AcrR family transcriptional regulator n=1 Tax=unclassified Cryobacterium TaxID=2649013 RepID=UPI002AB554E3|nr:MULTISPECIES: TetR/AcrR family transcriptional regulator [unclassified Cryobacterium]MDY7526760.1 TetR/AcrR family transcriptional regulator [Cryobacterium sp. 10C2]MDY7557436.1 TetR/AcrR family transcriptional regulator [Cryobacterium sp. 10C3]MEB0291649.1 TetR/AcrR family transcriptional regulator [Cryobacterium sp. 10C2]